MEPTCIRQPRGLRSLRSQAPSCYKSGDTELLGLVIEKATGRSLSDYASEKLWQPLGAEHPALWSMDKENGNEKAFCCFNSNARDFARIGQLMLDSGKWKGNTIIDSAYYVQSVTACNIPDEDGLPCDYYGYQWWIRPEYPGCVLCQGHFGTIHYCYSVEENSAGSPWSRAIGQMDKWGAGRNGCADRLGNETLSVYQSAMMLILFSNHIIVLSSQPLDQKIFPFLIFAACEN